MRCSVGSANTVNTSARLFRLTLPTWLVDYRLKCDELCNEEYIFNRKLKNIKALWNLRKVGEIQLAFVVNLRSQSFRCLFQPSLPLTSNGAWVVG